VDSLDQRRHGPAGYTNYRSYKPWLRDEHLYRCVYCLGREQWSQDGAGGFGADHFEPKSSAPHRETEYTNLCYCCSRCNSRKSDQLIPVALWRDPLDRHLEFKLDGTIAGRTREGNFLIDLLQLNAPRMIEWRQLWLELHADAQAEVSSGRMGMKARMFGFPSDLPDLASGSRPPQNTQPGSVNASAHARRAAGTLPAFYE
jgi:hypothetical protein